MRDLLDVMLGLSCVGLGAWVAVMYRQQRKVREQIRKLTVELTNERVAARQARAATEAREKTDDELRSSVADALRDAGGTDG